MFSHINKNESWVNQNTMWIGLPLRRVQPLKLMFVLGLGFYELDLNELDLDLS